MVDCNENKNENSKSRKFYYLEKNTYRNDIKRSFNNLVKNSNSFGKKLKKKRFYVDLLFKRFPIVSWLLFDYQFKKNLLTDIAAGFTVGVMNLPQCMAYAMLANLAPINGLYMSVFPIFIYALLGSSKQLIMGAVAVVSLMSGEIIQDLADDFKQTILNQNTTLNNTDQLVNNYKVSIACSIALFVGLLQILMALTGLGVLTTYFHDTFISAYTCGSAFHAIVSQFKDLLGLSNTTRFNGLFKIPKTVFDLAKKITTINFATTLVSVVCLIYLVLFKEFINPRIKRCIKFEFPSELLLVVGVSVISYLLNFNKSFGISIVKEIPRGLPTPSVPKWEVVPFIYKDGVLISLIVFSTSISLAKVFDRKRKHKIDATQELYAYGVSNIFASFFGCYPSCGSLSRTALNYSSGGKSQISSLASASVILLVILWLAPFFEPLPKACLASIVIVALKSLVFQIKDIFKLWIINKYEAIIWILTFLSVVFLDVDLGLFIGLIASAFLIVLKDQNDLLQPLTKYEDEFTFVDSSLIQLKNTKDIPANIKIIKIKKSLYYANIETIINKISKFNDTNADVLQKEIVFNSNNRIPKENDEEICLKESLKPNKDDSANKYLLLDFSSVNYVDSTAVKALYEIFQEYEKTNFRIFICASQKQFIQMLNNLDLIDYFIKYLFVTINEALESIA